MTTFTSEDLAAVLKAQEEQEKKNTAIQIVKECDGSFTFTCIEPIPFAGLVALVKEEGTDAT